MQRLIFEQSPFLVILCAAAGVGYSYLLYRAKFSWGIWTNRLLFVFRFTVVFFISLLLLGPIIKLILNNTEKPEVVILLDNSTSVKQTDSVKAHSLRAELQQLVMTLQDNGYAAGLRGLDGISDPQKFNATTSDINGALRRVESDYDGRNLAAIVLASDGIYNSGVSPTYAPAKVPVYTLGIGDTLQKRDLVLKSLTYNKITYLGNKFPLKAEVLAFGVSGQDITVNVLKNGKRLLSKTIRQKDQRNYLVFDFLIDTDQPGVQRFDVMVENAGRETNTRNNYSSAFIEVVEGKKKILVIAPTPHPDIKALRSVIEKNANYEFQLHIPGVKEAPADLLQPGKVDLVIFNQCPDMRGLTTSLMSKFLKEKTPTLIIVGQQSNIRLFPSMGIPVTYESFGQWDEIFGIRSEGFDSFILPEIASSILTKVPPLTTAFGKFTHQPDAKVILSQRIGGVPTTRPLLMAVEMEGQRMGILTAEGIWRWRLKEYDLTEKTEFFDDLFSKLIQYLGSKDDKRKFRCYPVQREFNDSSPAVFESQIFNEVYESQFGIPVTIEIMNERGEKSSYTYTTSPAQSRFSISLPNGIYHYSGFIERNGKKEEDRGQFSVTPQEIESQLLTADFGLLRSLSQGSGGKFYKAEEVNGLGEYLKVNKPSGVMHSEESFSPLIDLRFLFFGFLFLISTEWFFRKYLGSY